MQTLMHDNSMKQQAMQEQERLNIVNEYFLSLK